MAGAENNLQGGCKAYMGWWSDNADGWAVVAALTGSRSTLVEGRAASGRHFRGWMLTGMAG